MVQRIINDLSTSDENAVNLMDDNNLYDAPSAKVNVSRVGVSKENHDITFE